MPAKSEPQRKLFAVAEHNPSALRPQNKALGNLPQKTLHDFASTSGLKKKMKSSGLGKMRDSDKDGM